MLQASIHKYYAHQYILDVTVVLVRKLHSQLIPQSQWRKVMPSMLAKAMIPLSGLQLAYLIVACRI